MEEYRRFLWKLLIGGIVFTFFYSYICIRNAIPDEINLVAGSEQELDLDIPFHVQGEIQVPAVMASGGREEALQEKVHINLGSSCKVVTGETGNYQMRCSLLGILHLKDVDINVIQEKKLIPVGQPIGIYMKTEGVMVIGTGEVKGIDGMSYEPAYNLVRSGDYIEEINGQTVYNKKELVEKVNNAGEEAILTVRRNGEHIKVKVKCIKTSGNEQKMGVWVRDNTQGIGTVTYVDEEGNFGALGHGINDVDTGKLMELEEGTLYTTEIMSVLKGSAGNPGALEGVIYYNKGSERGTISDNTECGIFGQVNEQFIEEVQGEVLPICLKQEIRKGEAYIRCTVDGITDNFQVEILEIRLNEGEVNKGIVLKVTDDRLLEMTGGIVQGMSGSPIIQNEKIVGAVTHVFVQDSSMGYGIFIENMLRQN